MFVTRVVFLSLTYFSSQLAYHAYIVLAVDGLLCGCVTSITAIIPGNSVVITLGYNLCRIFVSFVQFIIDLFWHGRPMVMIRMQCWLSVFLTAVAVGSWAYYINSYCNTPNVHQNKGDTYDKPSSLGSQSPTKDEVATFGETMGEALSPFLMFPAGSMFKDFLYPGVLPYALLQRDKCHIINKISTVLYGMGSVTLFILEKAGAFNKWNSFYDGFWVIIVIFTVISTYTFMAIHTRIPSATKIRNSKPIVMTMTLTLIFYYSYLYTLSYAGVPKVVHTAFEGRNKIGNKAVITCNVICTMTYRFIFSKIAVGYNHTRVALGYHLPKFRPNHRMSKSNVAWYFIRNTFSRAGHDTIEDFRMNIRDYL
ncbi:hypothetical protein MACK_002251 [Theileria orientalis]|uniref:Uncharacterized protein n=1 Tax=Theileria orientalis TaxID=68886 RepID=A0A976QV71_THEOR|nr:hypothetical protein MACK_002251 [Theileria orientalis]